ncbi:MAG: hypothetical protein JNM27_20750 [Leptospirales bacterium]|nr:hypothetical protein [Leptospirales bacterium]
MMEQIHQKLFILLNTSLVSCFMSCSLFNPVTNDNPELSLLLANLSSQTIAPSKYLFVVSSGDSTARSYRISSEDGSLTLASSQATATPPLRTTAHPTLPVFYTTLNAVPGGVDAFPFDANTGVLSARVTQRTPGGENFSHIVMAHPNGNILLYSIVQSVTRFYRSNLTDGSPGAPVVTSTAIVANSQQGALTPNGNFLYSAAAGGGLQRFSVASDGTMVDLGNTSISGASISGRIQISPGSDFLFTTSSSNEVASFRIDSAGNLTPVSLFSAGVTNLPHTALNRDGTRFYVLSFGATIQTYSIATDGTLALMDQQGAPANTGIMCMDRSGRFLFVGQSAGAGDQMYNYRLEPNGIPTLKGSIVVGNTSRHCIASASI